jgi:hypothetical protein
MDSLCQCSKLEVLELNIQQSEDGKNKFGPMGSAAAFFLPICKKLVGLKELRFGTRMGVIDPVTAADVVWPPNLQKLQVSTSVAPFSLPPNLSEITIEKSVKVGARVLNWSEVLTEHLEELHLSGTEVNMYPMLSKCKNLKVLVILKNF